MGNRKFYRGLEEVVGFAWVHGRYSTQEREAILRLENYPGWLAQDHPINDLFTGQSALQ